MKPRHHFLWVSAALATGCGGDDTFADGESAFDTEEIDTFPDLTITSTSTATSTSSTTSDASATQTDSDSSGVECDDAMMNGDETDVDCGGSCPDGCANGEGCIVDGDCMSDACNPTGSVCADPTCMDEWPNGDETDVDCGGGTCDPCGDGAACGQDSDCVSFVCADGFCAAPACDDEVMNGDETDQDCGGTCGATCEIGEMCMVAGDCVLGLCTNTVCAQPAAASGIWFLTNTASSNVLIDFFEDPPTVTCNGTVGASTGIEGTGVLSDDSGSLRIYSDGISLYNGQTHGLISDQLSGNTTTHEAAAIIARPGSATEAYIFTNGTATTGTGVLAWSLVDLSIGNDGMVTSLNQALPEPPVENPGEALDVIPHGNGVDYWVLTYDGADEIVAHLVTAAGPQASPVRSDTGLTTTVGRGTIGHSEDGTRLVFGMSARTTIGVADFDPMTGVVSDFDPILTAGAIGYGAAFSPDNTKVYYALGVEGYSGTPQQYDLSTDINTELSATENTLGSVAIAPDGNMYFAESGSLALHRVNDPNAAGLAANFEADALSLDGCTSGYAIPNQSASH